MERKKLFRIRNGSVHQFIHPCVSIYPPIHPFICTFIHPVLVHPSIPRCIYPYSHPFVHPFIHSSILIHSSNHLSIYPLIHPSIGPFVHPSIHSYTHPCVFPSKAIHLSIYPILSSLSTCQSIQLSTCLSIH